LLCRNAKSPARPGFSIAYDNRGLEHFPVTMNRL
jgi:hypothetical protein